MLGSKPSTWEPFYNLIRELEKKAGQGGVIGFQVRMDVGDGGGLKGLYVSTEECKKSRANRHAAE